jgi:hypothetical protein
MWIFVGASLIYILYPIMEEWRPRRLDVKRLESMRRHAAIAAFLLFFHPSIAQKLVDPGAVAPEFRAAAEKRRPEQIRLNECAKKAAAAKVLVKDRATFISACVDSNNSAATGDAVK